jgi:hypothetical protein
MKHFVNFAIVLFSINAASGQENKLRTNYINLPPLIGTSIEVGREYAAKKITHLILPQDW